MNLICNKQYSGYIVGNTYNFKDSEVLLYNIGAKKYS